MNSTRFNSNRGFREFKAAEFHPNIFYTVTTVQQVGGKKRLAICCLNDQSAPTVPKMLSGYETMKATA